MNNLELLKVYEYKNKKRYGNKKDGVCYWIVKKTNIIVISLYMF